MKKIMAYLLLIQGLLYNVYAVSGNSQPTGRVQSEAQKSRPFFEELYEGDSIRRIYSPLAGYLSSTDSEQDQKNFLVSSRQAFQNDNALDAIPRILTPKESAMIQRGVIQRARALQAFLTDHYSGRRYYSKAGVIPDDIVRKIIARTGESSFDGKINPNTISFMYGPDIIRDQTGQWRVIEDNPGFIGGLGDLKLAYDLIIKKHPELLEKFEFSDPMNFYQKVAKAYIQKGVEHGGKTILYMTPPYADNEEKRIDQIFSSLGIEIVTPDSDKKLQITDAGVFLRSKVQGQMVREKVGYVFINGEHAWLDNTHPAAKVRNILEAANEYLKEPKAKPNLVKQIQSILSQVNSNTYLPDVKELRSVLQKTGYHDGWKSYAKGLLNAILKNKVGSNYSAGVDFIGDKEIYVYVEEMIRHYLHEEPILKNIPTEKFIDEKNGQIKYDLIEQVRSYKDQYVIKKVDGRGGDSVWVGTKISLKDLDQVLDEVKQNPGVYIVQKYMHLSVHGENIVDLRAISAVLPDQIIVAETPWGRGLPLSGNGKVNLSDKGREVTVLSVKNIKSELPLIPVCSRLFRNF